MEYWRTNNDTWLIRVSDNREEYKLREIFHYSINPKSTICRNYETFNVMG